MTRSDFSLVLVLATFVLVCYQPDTVTLLAFIAALLSRAALTLVPVAFDSKEEKLRQEFSKALATAHAEHETLKNRVDGLLLRGGR